MIDLKTEARLKLKENNLLNNDSDIISTNNHPTTCGIDGAFAVEKLLSTDIVAIAGVKLPDIGDNTSLECILEISGSGVAFRNDVGPFAAGVVS